MQLLNRVKFVFAYQLFLFTLIDYLLRREYLTQGKRLILKVPGLLGPKPFRPGTPRPRSIFFFTGTPRPGTPQNQNLILGTPRPSYKKCFICFDVYAIGTNFPQSQPLMKDCQLGVSPVNCSDSDIRSYNGKQMYMA